MIRRRFKDLTPQEQSVLISQVAQEIYRNRLRLGKTGDEKSDWAVAEKVVQSPWRTTLFASNRPLINAEKYLLEPFSVYLKSSAVFDIVERISPTLQAIGVILIPVAIWWFTTTTQEAKERQEQAERKSRERQEQAVRAQTAVQSYLNQISDSLATGKLQTDEDLQTIIRASTLVLLDSPDLQPDSRLDKTENWKNDRKGQTIKYLAETGLIQDERVKQLQGNNKFDQHKYPVISLSKANLRSANLNSISLIGVDFREANFNEANLSDADFRLANLKSANFVGGYLIRANFIGANLKSADFSKANLSSADLSEADLSFANFSMSRIGGGFFISTNLSNADFGEANLDYAFFGEANLHGADFSEATLTGSDLNNANLTHANFSFANCSFIDFTGADINNANFSGADLSFADFSKVQHWTEEQFSQAKFCKTKLPTGINLDPDRDCKELRIPRNQFDAYRR